MGLQPTFTYFVSKHLQKVIIANISGLVATTGALTMGLAGFMRGSPHQRFWMWCRVGSQAFTIFALLGGAYIAGSRQQEKNRNAVTTHGRQT